MNANVVILYVADQDRSRLFYRTTLAVEPVLDVPGMTEFDLGSVSLGLMPLDDMGRPGPGHHRRTRSALRAVPAA